MSMLVVLAPTYSKIGRFARPDRLGQVWPIRRNLIAWPLTSITDREADEIAGSLHVASDAVARHIEAAAARKT
jgi:hypothetical protein